MSYFLLNTSKAVNEINISPKYTSKQLDIFISKSLYFYINNMKQLIDDLSNVWDTVKKITNPYEYIHTNVPGYKSSICKFMPLSRSYFKMIEICNQLRILEDYKSVDIKTFSLCEGPGGFIEALVNLRNNKSDKYYGMTLLSDDVNIPGWRKSEQYLNDNNNIVIEHGIDNTGNIFNIENFKHCYNTYKNSFDIITGDGGFDFSIDFNKQEQISSRLIITQIIYGIIMQKHGGKFILKIFDVHTHFTVDIIHFLSSLYKKTYIIKPNTSRYANSERYIVCKDFKLKNSAVYYNKFCDILKNYQDNPNNVMTRLLNINQNYCFYNKLEDCNAIIGQQQLEVLSNTINIVNNRSNDRVENLKKINIQKCVSWCIKNKMPYNKNISNLNNTFQ